MNQWIKLYIEALHDRKLRKLSRFDKSVFYDLLLLAGQDGKNGQLPDIEDIALELDLKVTEAKKSLEHLKEMGLVEVINDNLVIHNFQQRQNTNLTGYEKVKRYRESHKEVIIDNPNDNSVITEEGYQTVINDNPNDIEMITVDKDKEIDKEKDKELREVKESVLKNARDQKTPKKHKHGQFGHVLLADDEYSKLAFKFDDLDDKIQNLDNYLENNRKKHYDNHYLTILNWAKRDAEKKKAKPAHPAQPKPQTQPEDWMEIADRIMAQDAVMGGLQ